MMEADDKIRFYVAQQYIQASKNMIDEMLKRDNPYAVISEHDISADELVEDIRYSSHHIILPALFCLYQGIELLLKGFLMIKCKVEIWHNAENLCGQFSKIYAEENELIGLFNKFVLCPKEFIREYIELNNITKISEFYNSLRYPDKKEKSDGVATYTYRDYDPLMYPDNEFFLPQVEELNNDIGQLLVLSVKLFRLLEDTP